MLGLAQCGLGNLVPKMAGVAAAWFINMFHNLYITGKIYTYKMYYTKHVRGQKTWSEHTSYVVCISGILEMNTSMSS